MTQRIDIHANGLGKWILSFCLLAFLPLTASAIDIKLKKDRVVVDDIYYTVNVKKEKAEIGRAHV